MNKHEICVHIKDDDMLQKAKELLEKYNQEIDLNLFYLGGGGLDNLRFCDYDKNWW